MLEASGDLACARLVLSVESEYAFGACARGGLLVMGDVACPDLDDVTVGVGYRPPPTRPVRIVGLVIPRESPSANPTAPRSAAITGPICAA